jgi:hypothetical protein
MKVRKCLTTEHPTSVLSNSPIQGCETSFQHEIDTGDFFAWDWRCDDGTQQPVGSLLIYSGESTIWLNRELEIEIRWSLGGLQSALLIDGYTHAVFDFAARCGYCRTGQPKWWGQRQPEWHTYDWDDTICAAFF